MGTNVQMSPDTSCLSRDQYQYYLEVRTSLFHFGRFPQEIEDDQEKKKLAEEVLKQQAINRAVQSSPEYAKMVVTDREVEEALNEIYDQLHETADEDFQLEAHGLSHSLLKESIEHDLRVAAVLTYVAEQESMVSDVDAELFYHMHNDRFVVPEKRHARHILVTINSDFAENKRDVAEKRVKKVLKKLRSNPNDFEKLAKQHSECPTALEGGVLGVLTHGQLYPELDEVLFSLPENSIADAVESPLGFHILRCDAIEPQTEVPFAEVKEKIKEALRKRNQRNAQRQWLAARMKADQPN